MDMLDKLIESFALPPHRAKPAKPAKESTAKCAERRAFNHARAAAADMYHDVDSHVRCAFLGFRFIGMT